MSETPKSEDHDFAESFRREYRRTPLPPPEGPARILASLHQEARPRRARFDLSAWLEPRSFTLRPIVAAGVVFLLLGAGALLARWSPRHDSASAPSANGASPPMHPVQFVLVAPRATRVTLVGDFNGWDAAATPMQQGGAKDAWSVTIPLASGWHAYAFVVDGARWVHDPRAPLAPSDEFGGPRSVVVVGEQGT